MRLWHRWIALGIIAVVNAVLLMAIGGTLVMLLGAEDGDVPSLLDAITSAFRVEWFSDPYWLGCCVIPAIVVTITQMMFTLPLLGSRPVMAPQGKPLMLTIAMAALIAAALSAGLFFAVAEVCGVFEGIFATLVEGDLRDQMHPFLAAWFGSLWPWVFIVIGWVIWTPLLLTFARRTPGRSRWSRWIYWLLGGTVLETLIVIPLDVMVRRRTECYCASGTLFALIISMWALLWLTGPGIVIAATSKRRRLWAETHCIACGHDKGPSPGANCPECGHEWRV